MQLLLFVLTSCLHHNIIDRSLSVFFIDSLVFQYFNISISRVQYVECVVITAEKTDSTFCPVTETGHWCTHHV